MVTEPKVSAFKNPFSNLECERFMWSYKCYTEPDNDRGMAVMSASLLLLLPLSEAAGIGWMKVDRAGRPSPAEHQDICDQFYQLHPGPSAESLQYHNTIIPGMNCDWEEEDCQWSTVPGTELRKSGESGLVRIKANENRYGKNKDGTFGKKNKGLVRFCVNQL